MAPESGGSQVHELRRMWPNVLEKVKAKRRVTWMMLLEKSDVIGVDEKQLQIGLREPGSLKAFTQSGHDEIVRQALIDVVGLDLMVVAVLDPSLSGAPPTPATCHRHDVQGAGASTRGGSRGPRRSGSDRRPGGGQRTIRPGRTTTRWHSTTPTPTTTDWPVPS